MNKIQETTVAGTTQKWEQPFRDLMDEIYWPGYADMLVKENPELYKNEYFHFISLYDEPCFPI